MEDGPAFLGGSGVAGRAAAGFGARLAAAGLGGAAAGFCGTAAGPGCGAEAPACGKYATVACLAFLVGACSRLWGDLRRARPPGAWRDATYCDRLGWSTASGRDVGHCRFAGLLARQRFECGLLLWRHVRDRLSRHLLRLTLTPARGGRSGSLWISVRGDLRYGGLWCG